ncbi:MULTISPECIES: hypothetical protein [Halobacteriovorax]|uniref:Uncharacterized protein n=1 Tax=Halobacteriovorax vibrionivorans TaxID=2152716 RepID=A0ABY0IH25_9BACT|nr:MULTISPECIES: hypothetical protein [Halobacteriovorax]RZF22251.1 hypothetical protein DAY19_00350 [Halobacteriovorax vibrionivorans]TGD48503.1 hypothetical protein EP118_03265 [Halobacteriovorax sp. Y22]
MLKLLKNPSLILIFSLLAGVFPQVYVAKYDYPDFLSRLPASSGQKTAYEVWGEMMESSVAFNAKATQVLGSGRRAISWGGEKEGSSSYVTRIFGPSAHTFEAIVEGYSMDEEEQVTFLRDFFSRWMNNRAGESIRVWIDEDGVRHDPAQELLDAKGRNKAINMSFLNNFDPQTASHEQLMNKWSEFISKTNNSPYSYLTPGTRRKFFKGEFSSLVDPIDDYYDMVPNLGAPEKYMSEIEDTSVGWEVKFAPQKSYGEFQEMIAWFKKTMGRGGELFQAPGHQRMVVPIGGNFNRSKAAELTKAAQALIVLEGIAGRSGIETADYKSIIDDYEIIEALEDGYETNRGPLRVDDEDRFINNSISIEFRSGTKNSRVARFIQASMASRFSRGDFTGISKADSWNIIGEYSTYPDEDDLVERFGLTRSQAQRAAQKLRRAGLSGYNIALWNWYDDNPMLGDTKKAILKNLTRDYLIDVASLRHTNYENLKKAVISLQREWVKSSNIAEDVKKYMMPARKFSDKENFHKFKPGTRMNVDVNKIDLGVEYSAKFPLKFEGDYAMIEDGSGGYNRQRLMDGKMSWLQTRVDMSPEEKEEYLKKMAVDLRDRLGGEGEPERLFEDGHGHGLDIAYKIKDSKDRSWRIEWDGIGRNYTPSGEVLVESVRAGSIEVVTPKFEPNMDEVQAVYDTFEKNNALPYIKAGGGHLNIDLTAFEGKPKEFARFLATFHEYRSVIAFLFQDLNRIKSAEPVDISEEFAQKLANWNGSEADLKKALYNEGYFNKRVGRKTRYTHLDVSAYFQDVIPPKFISDDFDISNPKVPWRPAFRVNPKIRKAEVRMFNAPRDAYESALQMKLFRAILNKALNKNDEISGEMQSISHEEYLERPDRLMDDLKKMTDDLGLEMREFRPLAGEALSNVEHYTQMKFYKPLADQLTNNPKFTNWERAVRPRGARSAISSEGRAYTGEISPEAREFQRLRIQSAEDSAYNRANAATNLSGLPQLKKKTNCVTAIRDLIGQ